MKKKIIMIPIAVFLLLIISAILELYEPKNKITGKTTDVPQAEDKDYSVIVGGSSIRPSFSVDINYNLEVYDKIEEVLKQIVNACSLDNDLETCVNIEVLKFNLKEGSNIEGYPVSIGCYEGNDGMFMDFMDYLINCSSTEEKGCECDHHIRDGEYVLSQSGYDVLVNARIDKNKYSATIKNSFIISSFIFSGGLNYRLAKDSNGKVLVVSKGEIGKECHSKSYKRKVYTFCYNTGKKLIVVDSQNNIVENEHKIRFAIDFSEPIVLSQLQSIAADISVDLRKDEAEQSEIEDAKKYENKDTQLKVEPTTTKPGIGVSYKYSLEGYNRPSGVTVDTIILHHTGDDAVIKAYNGLKNRKLSVHYIIDRDGTIYYLVDERKMSFHAKGWNDVSIGIEIVNTGQSSMDYTDAQYSSIKNLINDISKRWPSIQADHQHVKGHYEVSTIGKWDPSPNFDWNKIGLANHVTLADLGKKAPQDFGYA